jgi:hypothetical protein
MTSPAAAPRPAPAAGPFAALATPLVPTKTILLGDPSAARVADALDEAMVYRALGLGD